MNCTLSDCLCCREFRVLKAYYDDIYYYFGKQYEAMHVELAQQADSQSTTPDPEDELVRVTAT